MGLTSSNSGVGLTRKGDERITPLGRILRRYKLDELPQILNVLRGDMSIVGPRPKLATYVGIPNMPYRPGITGAATLEFRGEEEILRGFTDAAEMEAFYIHYIRPLKARLDMDYMQTSTFFSDMRLIFSTVKACAGFRGSSPVISSLWRVKSEREKTEYSLA
jgi:lipopolysaccharide/colanic/teichoic acid biosynthesis glycosyltransferase